MNGPRTGCTENNIHQNATILFSHETLFPEPTTKLLGAQLIIRHTSPRFYRHGHPPDAIVQLRIPFILPGPNACLSPTGYTPNAGISGTTYVTAHDMRRLVSSASAHAPWADITFSQCTTSPFINLRG